MSLLFISMTIVSMSGVVYEQCRIMTSVFMTGVVMTNVFMTGVVMSKVFMSKVYMITVVMSDKRLSTRQP